MIVETVLKTSDVEEKKEVIEMPPNVVARNGEEMDEGKLLDNDKDAVGDKNEIASAQQQPTANCDSPFSRSNIQREAQAFASRASLRCRNVANQFNNAEQRMRKMIIDAGHEIDSVSLVVVHKFETS